MPLKTQLVEDMKNAMRAHDSDRLGVIRYLMAQIKNVEIDHGEQSDEGVQKIVATQIKQMKDAISDFEKGGRTDLVESEQAKIKVLETYLPSQMSDEALDALVQQTIAEVGKDQMGKLIGAVMAKVKGQADGGRVSARVKAALTA